MERIRRNIKYFPGCWLLNLLLLDDNGFSLKFQLLAHKWASQHPPNGKQRPRANFTVSTHCISSKQNVLQQKIKVNIKRRLGEDKLPPERRMQLEEVQCMSDWRQLAFMLLEGVGWDAVLVYNPSHLLLPNSSSLRELIFYIITLDHRNPLEIWDWSKYFDSHSLGHREWEMVMPLVSHIPCS